MKRKPRIYWCFYPKSRRGYWRVSEMPKPFKPSDFPLWEQAHAFVQRLNESEDRRLHQEDLKNMAEVQRALATLAARDKLATAVREFKVAAEALKS